MVRGRANISTTIFYLHFSLVVLAMNYNMSYYRDVYQILVQLIVLRTKKRVRVKFESKLMKRIWKVV